MNMHNPNLIKRAFSPPGSLLWPAFATISHHDSRMHTPYKAKDAPYQLYVFVNPNFMSCWSLVQTFLTAQGSPFFSLWEMEQDSTWKEALTCFCFCLAFGKRKKRWSQQQKNQQAAGKSKALQYKILCSLRTAVDWILLSASSLASFTQRVSSITYYLSGVFCIIWQLLECI